MLRKEEFYPTPKKLIDEMLGDLKWWKYKTVLEPSAGRGDIAEYITKKSNAINLDCIEIDAELRSVLKGKGLRVVHDDFLHYSTYKQYDLIVMNPPFSTGATHLLKALDMQKDGGKIICIINAETLKNPYSNERLTLIRQLEEYDAEITYMQHMFSKAERKTDVEVAIVKVSIPKHQYTSRIWQELKMQESYHMQQQKNELIVEDYLQAAIARYNLEIRSGISLINEYKGLMPLMTEALRGEELRLTIGETNELNVNDYVRMVRKKYWSAILEYPMFTANMTSNLKEEYLQRVNEMAEYDFSIYNVKTIQLEMCQNLVTGIEECIIALFDELSRKYHWDNVSNTNIHYYNGWKTNKSWIINKKVILPLNSIYWLNNEYRPTQRDVVEKLSDMEKALNYLSGGFSDGKDVFKILDTAEKGKVMKNIKKKYFNITFYKKGTCHIEFLDEELLKKLNIFGSQQKKWLPPGYGKKTYEEMTPEEQAVVDSFEGKESYEETLQNITYYLWDAACAVPRLGYKPE